nr:adenylosuccinate synthase [bacterium]
QGGNNAGHTVVNERGKFILNLLPSGILRPGVINVMGHGMAIDLKHLAGEMAALEKAGVSVGPDHLKISNRAVICMPYHVLLDGLEEDRLKDKKYGSTRRGIGPVYGDKYMKKAILMGELLDPESLKSRVRDIVEWKNLTVAGGYGAPPIDAGEMYDYLMTYGQPLLPYICDTGAWLEQACQQGKNILFEAQLGALRDIEYGIYPYTSSSSTLAAYAPIGAGVAGRPLDNTIGIMKAYSTCVGEGPFTAELFGPQADALREAGGEYGAATGRPRRVGPFDVVASRYGTRVQGAKELALTKLDVLSYLDQIPVVTAYEVDGQRVDTFPFGQELAKAKPVVDYLPGWGCDISACRTPGQLPVAARAYIDYLEKAVGCPIHYVSVGPERDAYLVRE